MPCFRRTAIIVAAVRRHGQMDVLSRTLLERAATHRLSSVERLAVTQRPRDADEEGDETGTSGSAVLNHGAGPECMPPHPSGEL